MFTTAFSILFLFPVLPLQQGTGKEVEVSAESAVSDGDYIVLNFDETGTGGLTISQFIKICNITTGRNFIVEPGQKSTSGIALDDAIILYGTKRIKRKDFYSFFQAILKFHGLACIELGKGELAITLITKATQGTQSAVNPIVAQNSSLVPAEEIGKYADQPGTFVSTILRLKYLQPNDLDGPLAGILGGGTGGSSKGLIPMTGSKAVMISGYGPMVAAAVSFIKQIDVEPDTPKPVFRKIQLHEASAQDMAEMLDKILEDLESPVGVSSSLTNRPAARGRESSIGGRSGTGGTHKTSILANVRDNSLIVTATPENLERLLDLIAQLDSRIENPESDLHVYPLQFLNAKTLADDTLKDFLRQSSENSAQGRDGGDNVVGQNDLRVTVTAQESTNSLLITATRTKWAEMKNLLDLLDVEQPAVLIETALLEVSTDFARDIGFEFARATNPNNLGDMRSSISTSNGISSSDSEGNRVLDIFEAGLTAGLLRGDGEGGFSIPMLLRMVENNGNAQVLSKPSVLVDNNQVARIVSQDRIPFQTTSVTGTGVSQSGVDYSEAGIVLEISPSISASGFLRLGISLEVSSFRASSDPDLPPPTTSRKIDTVVHMPDGATIWIGGIVRDDYLESESGVPFLSDLPLIGGLFGRKDDASSKTTLFFFCTPKIIDTSAELKDISRATKVKAAGVAGIARMRVVDPGFEPDSPPDVIMEDGSSAVVVPSTMQLPGQNREPRPPATAPTPTVPPVIVEEPSKLPRQLPDFPR
jgi:type II secretion system protein D